jgi:hypothetical protein
MCVPQNTRENLEAALYRWYRQLLRDEIPKLIAKWEPPCNSYLFALQAPTVRSTRTEASAANPPRQFHAVRHEGKLDRKRGSA